MDKPFPVAKPAQFQNAQFGLVNKGLTKLTEECGELSQVACKKTQFMDGDEHPDGKGSLAARLIEEMGDVKAAIRYCAEELGLDMAAIDKRADEKYALNRYWTELDRLSPKA